MDESSIAVRRGDSLVKLDALHHIDTNVLSKAVKKVADIEKPYVIVVDVVGVGAGVADNLRSWGYRVLDFIAQGRAFETEKFINRRTESWYRVRERFRKDTINIPNDDKLLGQLTAPMYDFDAAGRYRLESKEDMKKRGLKSPDLADSVIMAFDYDGELESTIAKDYITNQPKPGTVEEVLNMLTQGSEEDVVWHHMKF